MTHRSLPAALLPLIPAAVAAAADPGSATSLSGVLVSTALLNFLLALALVLLFVLGMYAYAGLARFAPYHSWIYLYLVSLSGIVWAFFLLNYGGSPAVALFLLISVVGLDLVVHILRFDRIEMPFLHGTVPGQAAGPAEPRKPVPLPGNPR